MDPYSGKPGTNAHIRKLAASPTLKANADRLSFDSARNAKVRTKRQTAKIGIKTKGSIKFESDFGCNPVIDPISMRTYQSISGAIRSATSNPLMLRVLLRNANATRIPIPATASIPQN